MGLALGMALLIHTEQNALKNMLKKQCLQQNKRVLGTSGKTYTIPMPDHQVRYLLLGSLKILAYKYIFVHAMNNASPRKD